MKKQRLTSKSGIFGNYVQEEGGSVSILLYGNVGTSEQVDPADIVSQLIDLSNRFDKINIRINSNGGDVFSGISIYNALKQSKADITIYVDGIAASIAGIIALCGKPLFMSQYAKLMVHSVSGGVYGNKDELRNMISIMENMESVIAEMISGRCQKSKEEIQKLYFDGKDHWITAQEALSMGLIDGLYDVGEELPEDRESIYNFFNNKLLEYKTEEQSMELLNKIKTIPSFANMQTEEQVVNRIKELESREPIQSAQTLINKAVEDGIFRKGEASELLSLSDGNVERLRNHIEKQRQKKKTAFEKDYADLIRFRSEYTVLRDLSDDFINNELKQLASKDFRTFKIIVEASRKKLVSEHLPPFDDKSNKVGWTLEDYRKKAPQELKRNPQLYKELLERENQNKY